MSDLTRAKAFLRAADRLVGRINPSSIIPVLFMDDLDRWAAELDRWANRLSASGLLLDDADHLEAAPGRIIVRCPSRDDAHQLQRPYIGKVTSVGRNVPDFRVGDKVAFGRYSGIEMHDFIILNPEEILAVVHDEE